MKIWLLLPGGPWHCHQDWGQVRSDQVCNVSWGRLWLGPFGGGKHFNTDDDDDDCYHCNDDVQGVWKHWHNVWSFETAQHRDNLSRAGKNKFYTKETIFPWDENNFLLFLAAERRHSHQWQACKDFWIQQSGWECFLRWFRIWWFYNFMFCQSIDGALGCEIMDRRRRCIALPQERGAAKFFWANYFVHPSPSAPWTLHLFLFTNSDQLLRPDRVPAWKTPCRGWTPPGSASCFQSLYH